MKPLKLRLILEKEEDPEHLYWDDLYLDVDKIEGFYIGPPIIVEDERVNPIVICVLGNSFLIKQQRHIIHFLTEKFINKPYRHENKQRD